MVSLKLSQGRNHQRSAEVQSFKSHNTSRSFICFGKKMQGTNIFRKVTILARLKEVQDQPAHTNSQVQDESRVILKFKR